MSEQELETSSEEQRDITPAVAMPGARLRTARESMALTIEEAARRLHLDARLLQALEEDDHAALPGATYLYGYLRSYARLLKLPEDEVLAGLQQEEPSPDDVELVPQHLSFSISSASPFSAQQFAVALLLILVIVGAVVWYLWLPEETQRLSLSRTAPDQTVAAVETSMADVETADVVTIAPEQPVAEQAVTEVEPVAVIEAAVTETTEQESSSQQTGNQETQARLHLSYDESSWTEVKDVNGKVLVYRVVNKGTVLPLDGEPPFTVLLGYAPGVTVKYDNKVFDTKPYQRDDIAYFLIGHRDAPANQ